MSRHGQTQYRHFAPEDLLPKRRPTQHEMDTAFERILAALGEEKFSEWLATAPDDNAGFLAAVDAKLVELDTAQATADAASLAAFVERWADQDADWRDWTATRESDRPI